jgi:competence protein ComEA
MSKAQAIVDHRKAHGPFKSADDLARVKGIGKKTVERNMSNLKFEGGKPAAAPSGG